MLRSERGQTASEYMLVLSVLAIGAMAALAAFHNPNGPVQSAAESTAKNYTVGLTNGDNSTMQVQ